MIYNLYRFKNSEDSMKPLKISLAVLLCLVTVFSLFSCKDGDTSDTGVPVVYYTVSFDSAGGSDISQIKVLSDTLANEPERPVRDGYIFSGWTLDNITWDFSSDKVTSDMTLHAAWIDASTVYTYESVDGGISITGIKNEYEIIEIPKQIGGLAVVAISDGAFAERKSNVTKKIIVPNTVTSIGKGAFYGCSDIEIEINGNLTSLGESSFALCSKLSAVTLGEGLSELPAQAFGSCSSLVEINIPDSVTKIDENAFEECISLSSVSFGTSLAEICDSAFIDCDALENVNYRGSKSDFEKITIENGNTSLKTAQITYSKD